MSAKTWILTDHKRNHWVDSLDETAGPFAIRKSTLKCGLSQGVDLVTISNGHISLDIIPTRGMNVWQGRVGKTRLGWNSPVKGPVHPAFVRLEERGGIGWTAGFDEWIARCGLGWMGAPCTDVVSDPFGNEVESFFPLHGRISNIPAQYVEIGYDVSKETLTVYGIVDEAIFHAQKLRLHARLTLKAEASAFEIHDAIENIGGCEQAYQMLYHTNFGPPMAEEGAYLEGDFESTEPRDAFAQAGLSRFRHYGPPLAGKVEEVFFHRLRRDADGRQNVRLINPERQIQVTLDARQAELPCFCQWKNEVALADGYVTGLEFGTGFPTGCRTERDADRLSTLVVGQAEEFSLIIAIESP